MPLLQGDRLGPYEILAQVGAGGMGEVYKARDTRLDRTVAVKVSPEKFSERFEREARAVAALNHPNICQLYDVGPNYLVMEFVEGSPIAPPDSSRKLLDLAVQIADGLGAAHAAGLIHRDLKPDNILVTRDGRVKILDFGLAKSATTSQTDATRTMALTDPGTTVGTVNYMSPEQARGETNLTPQSDQFSLGLVLYELTAAKRPFQRGSAAETMTAIIREDADPLPAATPAPLRWVIERLLSKEPTDRYDSTRDLYRELRQIRERFSQATSAAQTAAAARPIRRRLIPVLAVGATCLIVGAASALSFLPASSPDISAYKFTPISRQDATERQPAWSPDGKSIVFIASVHGIPQVFTKTIGSPEFGQITHADASCENPFWSPDGSTIYYISTNALWGVPASGGTAEIVLDDVTFASVHPDGRTLAFLRRGKLWVGSLKGEPPHEFGSSPFSNSQLQAARFSPDGRKLAAGGLDGGWILPYPSGTPRRINSQELLNASWFPDSRRLLISPAEGTANFSLAILDIEAGTTRTIYKSTMPVPGSVSPDGKRIVYQQGQTEWDVLEIELASGSVHTAISGSGVISWWPDWGPSGTHYLVNTDRSGILSIDDVSSTDGFLKPLFTPESGGRVLVPRWSPDGSRFAFFGGSNGRGLVLTVSNSSGGRSIALDSGIAFGRPSWSPDGQWIAYYRGSYGRPQQLAKIRAGSNPSPIILAELPNANASDWSNYVSTEWSPTGEWIAYPGRDGIHLISPDGKITRRLTDRKLQVFGFSTDGSKLFGVLRDTSGQGPQWKLYSVDMRTGLDRFVAPVNLPVSTDSIASFSMHPDGKRFLTSIGKWPFDIWMMEGFDTQPKSLLDRLLRR